MNRLAHPFRYLACLATLSLIGCGNAKFERDWNQAVAAYKDSDDSAKSAVVGPWTGQWLSHVNGHHGDLRCLVTAIEDESSNSNLHEFRYHATWQKFFSGGYTAEYSVESDAARGLNVSGMKDLGPFGSFEHEGWIQGDHFDSTFASSQGDHGVFELKRP